MQSFIPQCDPQENYISHKIEIDSAIARVLYSGKYILGEEVEKFEEEFARFVGTKYAVSVASGTDALELALRACGINAGDYVATVSHTAVATISAIRRIGAIPLFCDIDIKNYCMSTESLEELIFEARKKNLQIKAVVPVHLYGHPVEMKKIVKIANENSIILVEDCAQAHGAKIEEQRVGTFGIAGAFSFYPTKNLGAIGDGGTIVTNSERLSNKLRLLRQYGWKMRYISAEEGFNSRLDELQAAILRVKLKYLDAENKQRRKIASLYDSLLKPKDIIIPNCDPKVYNVYHQYVIRSKKRDELQKHLLENGIGTLIHYPKAVHQQPAYQSFPLLVSMKNTEKIVNEILSLPIYPELHNDDIQRICSLILMYS